MQHILTKWHMNNNFDITKIDYERKVSNESQIFSSVAMFTNKYYLNLQSVR